MMNTFYCLNQYLYNHFESSVLIVTNCSDYLNIELFIALSCTRHSWLRAHCLFLSYHSYVYALSFIIACTFLLSCHAICIVYATLPFLCALNYSNAYTNFCINVNSDRFSESAFEFVWHLVWVCIFTSLYILLILNTAFLTE